METKVNSKKYNISVPRYTSYPTVPFWESEKFSVRGYEESVQSTFLENNEEVSLYIHLPYCESLCTYCACNTRITKNHNAEYPYIEHLLSEWDLYLARLPKAPIIREIHLGGGTPTFFSAENLERLIGDILKKSNVPPNIQMSFEGHPANTSPEHLKQLHQLGFERLSLGIQDFDSNVQKLINRRQTYKDVKEVTDEARKIGYTSINFDMVYGLPGQSTSSLESTMNQVISLAPDRVAYYSYAHVPSMKPAQRSYEPYLPNDVDKQLLQELGRAMLRKAGYEEVGLDHFVLPHDELLLAQKTGKLHRNFMGYTTSPSKLLIGLGVSSISDSWTGFAQNHKNISTYFEDVEQGRLPIAKGHLLTPEDEYLRKHIMNLMCDFQTTWNENEIMKYEPSINYQLLEELSGEGYIELRPNGILVLPQGREIIRVICSAMDARLNQSTKSHQFSKSI